jgi:hypothetical protein
MRSLLFLIVLTISWHHGISQPAGKLYFHTQGSSFNQKGVLGYITHPGAQISFIDSTNLTDFIISGNDLYVANGNIYRYSIATNQLTDSITGTDAHQLGVWNNRLIALSNTAPHFRVYDTSTKNLVFALGTGKVSYKPNDILVTGNRAFLLLNDSVIVIDMLLQDTVARFFTFHPFPFAGVNSYVIEKGGFLYVDVEYITGAVRFSLLKIDKTTYQISTLFHYEGAGSFYRPVLLDDNIWLAFLPSRYNIPMDSLTIVPNFDSIAVAADSISHSLFVHNLNSKQIYYLHQSIAGGFATLPNQLTKAVFISSLSTKSHEANVQDQSFTIYPNPANDKFTVKWLPHDFNPIFRLYNSLGKLLQEFNTPPGNVSQTISTAGYPAGIYWLQCQNGSKSSGLRVMIVK